MQATTTASEWLTVREAAAYARAHPQTIYDALRKGDLHGAQSGHGGKWTAKRSCIDSWKFGERCEHRGSRR